MSTADGRDAHVPEGQAFWHTVWDQEDQCEQQTDEVLPKLGREAPPCFEHLGTVLSLLDRMASCWWGCRGGDHLIEYLCGRVSAHGRSAVRLARFGLYDESLALCRSVGEIANLLYLFSLNRSYFDDWKTCPPKQRFQQFSLFKVREFIKVHDKKDPPIDQRRYKLLCEQVAHVNPDTRPQAHNPIGQPMVGARFQLFGFWLGLNELALPVSIAATHAVMVLPLEKNLRVRIINEAIALAEQIGSVTIDGVDDIYRQARAPLPKTREELEQLIQQWVKDGIATVTETTDDASAS